MSVGKVCVVWVVAVLVVVGSQSTTSTSKPPNIVFILTDDQDLVLGGMVGNFSQRITLFLLLLL